MREEDKTRIASAGGALATAISIAALRSGKFGPLPFSLQLATALSGTAWIPYLHKIDAISKVPRLFSMPIIIIWSCLCFAPAFFALLVELFTGHRRPGAQWYDGVWRVYAIMALWLGVSVLIERVIRPWWRTNSDRFLGGIRNNSVAAQARTIALDKRTEALEALKKRVQGVLKKKKQAISTIATKKEEGEKAQENIERAEGMLVKAKAHADTCSSAEKEEANEVVETMKGMVGSAQSHKHGLHADIERLRSDLEEYEKQLKALQLEWTEALHINNHHGFYR